MRSIPQLGYAILKATGALAAWRALAPAPVVLTYHNVIGPGEVVRGDASLHLPADRFSAQMEWIANRFEVVPLWEAADAMLATSSRPVLALTFDDAYCGVLEHAVPILHRFKLPATVMVVQSAAESPQLFWWDVVAEAKPQLDRNHLRVATGGRGAMILEVAEVTPEAVDLPDEYWPADWSMLRNAQSETISMGAHTRNHPMLTALAPKERDVELAGPRAAMAEQLGGTPSVLAYPYGDWNLEVAAAAARVGYGVAVTTDRRWAQGVGDRMSIPRQTISSGMTLPAFAAAASRLRMSR